MAVKVWQFGKGWSMMVNPVEKVNTGNVANAVEIQVTKPGAFEKNGEIFIVKWNREKTRMYALKLKETSSDRLTETGEHVQFDFEYAKGAIYNLSENDRMSVERAKELMIRYGKCIICSKKLTVASSVERGIGPVCIKYFRGYV